MTLDIDIPQNNEAERKLLGALLLMLPAQRDQAIRKVSASWFIDPWHCRVFAALLGNRGRDIGLDLVDAIREFDANDRAVWWLSQLVVDRNGDPVTNPKAWRDYAATLQRVYAVRVKILTAIEMLKDAMNDSRIETLAVCDAPGRDEEVSYRTPVRETHVVLDGVAIA